MDKLKTSTDKSVEKDHYIEDATCHYILKKILEVDTEREKASHLSNKL